MDANSPTSITQNPELVAFIKAGSFLVGSARSNNLSDMRSVLMSRLLQYDQYFGRDQIFHTELLLEDIQLETALRALHVLNQVQALLSATPSADMAAGSELQNGNIIGTRDLTLLRTLLSIVFKWAIEPMLARVMAAIPGATPGQRSTLSSPTGDLNNARDNIESFSSVLIQLFLLLSSGSIEGSLSPPATHIGVAILDRHLSDLLRPCIILGWLPKSLASNAIQPVDTLRPSVLRLLSILPVQQSVTALTGVLSEVSGVAYARRACTFLLSRQLMRRNGVHGTIAALFEDEDDLKNDAPLEKLEHLSRLFQAVPVGIKSSDYFGTIVPQLVVMLKSPGIQSLYLRSAAFSLSRILSCEDSVNHAIISRIALPILQRPFLSPSSDNSLMGSEDTRTLITALSTLEAFLSNTDPSPNLISNVLSPIIPVLFTLSSQAEHLKAIDPTIRASLRGCLDTWGRLVPSQEGIAVLWLIVEGEGGQWEIDVTGELREIREQNQTSTLSLFTPDDLKRAEDAGEMDVSANPLHLRPDPVLFVQFLKSIGRPDITSELFVRLIEAYWPLKSDSSGDPFQPLLYLQIVIQIQSQFSDDNTPTAFLKKPEHILSFVKHSLEPIISGPPSTSAKQKRGGLGVGDLRFFRGEGADTTLSDRDSDDEDEPQHVNPVRDEDMTTTALNLLLSVLEANPSLSGQTTPILNEIFNLVETLATKGSDDVKVLAREARMILTVRLASTSMASTVKPKLPPDEEKVQETYQKALKLLQDPLLPVRAHGLLLLRQLVSPSSRQPGSTQGPPIDKALVPGILSIFLQSLQDEDSYIFLNAVQGLAAMVDAYGKDTLKGLLNLYAPTLDVIANSGLTQQEIDTRTRIGEALGQAIRRCGDALPKYADILVPTLFAVFRSSHLATTLRVSALSLLAQCVNTSVLSLLPYSEDMVVALTDLLRVEAAPIIQKPKSQAQAKQFSPDGDEARANKEVTPTMDNQPTAVDSKFPPLRRAALHLLSLISRAYTNQILESSSLAAYAIPGEQMVRARNVVNYVAAIDRDDVVRAMAREALEGLDRLRGALVGL